MFLSGGFKKRLEMNFVSADEEYEMSDEEKQTVASTHEESFFTQLLQSEVAVREL